MTVHVTSPAYLVTDLDRDRLPDPLLGTGYLGPARK